jgi:hypothetical protein
LRTRQTIQDRHFEEAVEEGVPFRGDIAHESKVQARRQEIDFYPRILEIPELCPCEEPHLGFDVPRSIRGGLAQTGIKRKLKSGGEVSAGPVDRYAAVAPRITKFTDPCRGDRGEGQRLVKGACR